jgi:ADP-heptose:LPS heptosyltransferase
LTESNADGLALRILVTRLRYLGDIILSTPLLDVLRERLPAAHLEYLTHDAFAPALEGHPALDRVHRLPARPSLRETFAVVSALRRPRLDWCFDLFGNPRSALIVALAAPRHSVGPARGLRSRLYGERRGRPPGDRSAIRHHLDKLVPLFGQEIRSRPPRIHVRADERQAGARLATGDDGGAFVLVHPGSTWPDKAWPEDRWPSLIEGIIDRLDLPVRVIEPPNAPGLAQKVAAQTRGDVRPLPQLGLRPLLGVVAASSLYVGNDGGILHAAVATQVPTVGLLGPTEPDIWFPYGQFGPYRCVHHMDPDLRREDGTRESRLRGLGTGRVLAAVDEVLGAVRTRESEGSP